VAVADYFLKIDGIDGESQDHKHKGEIHLESWSWGESNGGSAAHSGGAGAGKVNMQDFHFVRQFNKASPKLAIACASGEHLKKAVLTCRRAGKDQQEFFKVTMSDLIVSSFQTGASNHGDVLPTEQISLNFSKIEWEYKEQKADGTLGGAVKAGWDQKQTKAV
jgi:type VI secretion system secreted protein Hcp